MLLLVYFIRLAVLLRRCGHCRRVRKACDALAASRDVVSLPRSRCGALRKCPANVESCWPFGSAGLAEEEDAFALQKRVDLSPRPHFPDVLIVQIAFLRSMTLRLVVWLLRTLNRGPRTWRITSNSHVVTSTSLIFYKK